MFSLIGCGLRSREIATMLGVTDRWVLRTRGKIGRELGMRGSKLIVTAVKAVWIQEHSKTPLHIAEALERLKSIEHQKHPSNERHQKIQTHH